MVGSPEPVKLAADALAGWSRGCIAVAAHQIATFASGQQTPLRAVPGVSDFLGVTAGPGGFFAAVGAARGSASVLTTLLRRPIHVR